MLDAQVWVAVDDGVVRGELLEALADLRPKPLNGFHPLSSAASGARAGIHVLVAAGQLFPRGERSLPSRLTDRAGPDCRIVIVVERLARREVRRAIDDGVDGLVLRSQTTAALVPTVHAVLAGQLVLPREHGAQLEPPRLSVREKQVLSLVVMGMSNREIANQLFIAETTVKTHLATAFRKLDVQSRAEAARIISDPNEGLGTGILSITK